MKILYAASEARPFIASGGLADVAGSLPAALQAEGHECRVVIPMYGSMKKELRDSLTYITNFYVPLGWRRQYCGLFKGEAFGVTYYLLDNEYYFKRPRLYGYDDDGERFAFFAKAVLEMLQYVDYAPELINCNDWQTALTPVYLNLFYRHLEKFSKIRTVFTIHNIAYQGRYGLDNATNVYGLPYDAVNIVEYNGDSNMMKGAIVSADMISTVSPTYASEILDSYFGYGLENILRDNQWKLCGILNGIDVKTNDPATDPNIYKNYSAEEPDGKAVNKEELQKYLGLDVDPKKPLLVMVSRMVAMKGFDLVRYIADEIVGLGVQFAILGSGDSDYENYFNDLAMRYPGKVAFYRGFVPPLAQKMYAGADMFLMPSQSEPCGLAQMVALRYGTIPIIRETGGLKDSIKDLGGKDGNGFTFVTFNAHDMLYAISRAVDLYKDEKAWHDAVIHAMKCDFSWSVSAKVYVDMYQAVLDR